MKSSLKHMRLSATAITLGMFVLLPSTVQAQITNPAAGKLGKSSNAKGSTDLFTSYFITIWNAFITLGGLATLIFFLWGAIEWLSAGQDTGKVEKARQRMTNAGIGLIVLVSSFAIIGFFGALFFGDDFNILKLTFPTAI